MYSLVPCLLVLSVLLGSSLGLSRDGYALVDLHPVPVFDRVNSGESLPSGHASIPNTGHTTLNIYPSIISDASQDSQERSHSLCNDAGDKDCQMGINISDTEARTSTGRRPPGSISGVRKANQHQHPPYPPGINFGNAVQIQGNFQGASSQQGQPHGNVQLPQNVQNTNGVSPQQSPLLSFDMHSEPHFYPNVPNSFYPYIFNNHQTQAPVNNQQPQVPVDTSGTIFRVNSKLLLNSSDITNQFQTLHQQSQTNIRPKSDIAHHVGVPEEQHKQDVSKVTLSPVPSTTILELPLQSNSPHNQVEVTTPEVPYSPWATQEYPLTQSQSLAILKSQINSQQKLISGSKPQQVIPPTASTNTVNIQVPTGSSVTTHQHQSDIADILTNLQILTILMNQDNKTKAVMNGVRHTNPQPSNDSSNSRNHVSRHNQSNMQSRIQPSLVGPIFVSPPQTQGRTKSQIISSLPHYANQFAFTANQVPDSVLDIMTNYESSQSNFDVKNHGIGTAVFGSNHKANDPRINVATISNIVQDANDPDYFNRLVHELAMSHVLSESQDKPVTGDTPLVDKNPQVFNSDDSSPQENAIVSDSSHTSNSLPIYRPSQQNMITMSASAPLSTDPEGTTQPEISNPFITRKPQNTTPLRPQFTLQHLQDLEKYNSILNNFNNRHQNQANTGDPTRPSISNIPDPQDLILASILQSQVLRKPEPTPPVIRPNTPYVPALHSDSAANLQSIFPQPPAPPPTSAGSSFTPTGFPFPVRSSGGSGGSSYSNIQECLKNTACALFLAGVVATGTTAALAIPVLTPLFGAGFLGRRRKRDIHYFVIKPEDTTDFIDNYFQYANGTGVADVSEEVRCIYNSFMNPEGESSKTVLGSLFKYIFENRGKLLNISVHETNALQQKPIPESVLHSLIKNNTLVEMDASNDTEILNSQLDYDDINTTDSSNSSDVENYDDITNMPTLTNPVTHSHTQPELSHEENFVDNGEMYQSSPQISDQGNIPYDMIRMRYNNHFTSNANTVTSSHQDHQIPTFTQVPEHSYQADIPFNPHIVQAPQTGQPVFRPQFPSHSSSYGDLFSYEDVNLRAKPSTLLHAKLQEYLNSVKRNGDYLSSPHVTGFPVDIPTRSEVLSTQLAQQLPFDYQPRNRHSLVLPPKSQAIPSHQEDQSTLKIVDFYNNLCQALGEPGIPRSSVISFIAQRCFVFASAGLIQ